MPSVDTQIENSVAAIILAAYPDSNAQARKTLVLREGETSPRVLVRCSYESGQAGDSDAEHRRNCFYSLTIRIFQRSGTAVGGDTTIKEWREGIAELLYGPELPNVIVDGRNVVDDIRPVKSGMYAPGGFAQLPAGIDSEVLSFVVETFEP